MVVVVSFSVLHQLPVQFIWGYNNEKLFNQFIFAVAEVVVGYRYKLYRITVFYANESFNLVKSNFI